MPADQRIRPFTSPSRAAFGAAVASAAVASAAVVAALAAAPVALAAVPQSGGASLTPTAAAVQGTTAPFTIGLSASSVPAGSRVTISGLANARADTRLTIVSNVFSASRLVGGAPAITTPALAEGTYRATALVAPAIRPGAYAILLRAGGRQVASTSIRVTARGGSSSSGTSHPGNPRVITGGGAACAGIRFTVLHNDRAAGVVLPAGTYRITSPNLACSRASANLTTFLDQDTHAAAGWTATASRPGHATYTQKATGLKFTVARQG